MAATWPVEVPFANDACKVTPGCITGWGQGRLAFASDEDVKPKGQFRMWPVKRAGQIVGIPLWDLTTMPPPPCIIPPEIAIFSLGLIMKRPHVVMSNRASDNGLGCFAVKTS